MNLITLDIDCQHTQVKNAAIIFMFSTITRELAYMYISCIGIWCHHFVWFNRLRWRYCGQMHCWMKRCWVLTGHRSSWAAGAWSSGGMAWSVEGYMWKCMVRHNHVLRRILCVIRCSPVEAWWGVHDSILQFIFDQNIRLLATKINLHCLVRNETWLLSLLYSFYHGETISACCWCS
jgi:hypothetical protein